MRRVDIAITVKDSVSVCDARARLMRVDMPAILESKLLSRIEPTRQSIHESILAEVANTGSDRPLDEEKEKKEPWQ